jgi:hypothetical protein
MIEAPDLDAFIANYSSPILRMPSRHESCRLFWESIPEDGRVSVLLEVLARYRICRKNENGVADDLEHVRESFALNELTSSCYALNPQPTKPEALAILRTAYHTCGHGDDAVPPLTLALKHFEDKPYTGELFDAIRAYRESLSHSRGIIAQGLKGRMDLILWQDWQQLHPWQSCWTVHIRSDLQAMPIQKRKMWSALFQSFAHCIPIEPTKKWSESSKWPLEQLTGEVFSNQMRIWLEGARRIQRPQLSTPGSHVLKNLIWCAAVVDDAALDCSLMSLIDVPWKNRQPMDKVAGALAFLWTQRDLQTSIEPLERVAKRYAYPGGKIEQYFRLVRDVSIARGLRQASAV